MAGYANRPPHAAMRLKLPHTQFMNNKRCSLALLICCLSIGSFAQQIKRAKKEFRLRHFNVVSLSFPNYMEISGYGGISVGLSYERFFGRKGFFSASLAMESFWAGSEGSRFRTYETSTKIKGSVATPGFFFHPVGIREGWLWSTGVIFPVGSMYRQDISNTTSLKESNIIDAVLLQTNIQVYPSRNFALKVYASWGTLLSAPNTEGNLWQVGLQFGHRF